MATTPVGIAFKGKDEVSKEVDKVESRLKKFQSDAQKGFGLGAGMAVTNMIGNVVQKGIGVITDSIGSAAEELQQEQVLKNALEQNFAFDGNFSDIQDRIGDLQDLTGFTDGELRPALQRLMTGTESVDEAFESLALAADFARFSGRDLATMADLINKVYAGDFSTLKRYGIVLEGTATKEKALAAIREAASGSAASFMQGDAGRITKAQNDISDALQELGKALLPLVGAFANLASGIVKAMMDAGNGIHDFLFPHQAEINEVETAMFEMAAAAGLSGAAVVEFSREQRKAREEAEALARAEADLAWELEQFDAQTELAILNAQQWLTEEEAIANRQAERQALIESYIPQQQELNEEEAENVRIKGLANAELQAYIDANPDAVGATTDLADAERTLKNQIKGVKDVLKTLTEKGLPAYMEASDAAQDNIQWLLDHPGRLQKAINQTEKEINETIVLRDKAIAENNDAAAAAADEHIAALETELAKLKQLDGYVVDIERNTDINIDRTITTTRVDGSVEKRHAGGHVASGGTYLVGEKGPELLTLGHSGGRVTPNHKLGGGDPSGMAVYLDGKLVGRVLDEQFGKMLNSNRAGRFARG